MVTYVIGRSAFADIVVADDSVAPRHAELVVTDDGRFHITDCTTATGTWRQAGSNETYGTNGEAPWEPVRQAFVSQQEPLRFGGYLCTLKALLQTANADRAVPQDGRGGSVAAPDRPQRHKGRVERDAKTGEIVRTRFFGDG